LRVADFAWGAPPALEQLFNFKTSQLPVAQWRDSSSICSLADADRHLGHIVKAGNHWLAFDAVHPNVDGTGFRVLGCWDSIQDAKDAVEQVFRNDLGVASTVH